MPLAVFLELVKLIKDTGDPVFNYGVIDACGQQSIPLEIKVMMVARTLGSGLMFTDVAELSGMSTSSACVFFKFFCKLFVLYYYENIIHPL